jgi:GWxTD domain-containing protein
MKRNSCLAILALLAASRLTADGLSPQYKDWPKSPEAYFLTAEEKAQWKNVKDDGQAKEFVERYYARRAPDLPQVLKERIGVADKYFSAGKVKGSETLRGKVIILFGPPSELKQDAGEGIDGPGNQRGSCQRRGRRCRPAQQRRTRRGGSLPFPTGPGLHHRL